MKTSMCVRIRWGEAVDAPPRRVDGAKVGGSVLGGGVNDKIHERLLCTMGSGGRARRHHAGRDAIMIDDGVSADAVRARCQWPDLRKGSLEDLDGFLRPVSMVVERYLRDYTLP